MDYDEFRRRLGKAGLSIKDFASILYISATTVSNYKKKGAVPLHMAIIVTLLAEMAENHLGYRSLLANIRPPQPKKSSESTTNQQMSLLDS
jgi:transcriptional regulator with XRE-family HTH domain